MPPIPTKLPEEALSIISAIERRLTHISEVEVPKLRECTGPLSVQQTLAEDVREDTVALTRQIEVRCLRFSFIYVLSFQTKLLVSR